MKTGRRRPLRSQVLRRLMPPALVAGVIIWAVTAYLAHMDHVDRLRNTLRQGLELRAAVTSERIEAVAEAVRNAAKNSITVAAMAGQDVDRVVQPYLKSIAFADATTERVALVDYRARLIIADRDLEWKEPTGWMETFERVSNGAFQSLVEKDRLVFTAPVVLGTFVEGALVADVSLPSLFVELEADLKANIVELNVAEPQYDLDREGNRWNGTVIWPVADAPGIALRLRKSIPGAGFWDNPVQTLLASVFGLLIMSTVLAINLAANSVAAPVRRLVEELAERGLEIGAPSRDAPAEIWSLARRFVAAAADVEQALLRERELTAQQSQFVSMVSHEFRTPLAIIDGATGALRRRRKRMDDDAVSEKLNVISAAVTRLLRLMESTLTAARLDSDGFKVEATEFQFSELVRKLVDERVQISPHAKIELNLADFPDTVCADERLITSVIDNLLSNAVKYGGSPPVISVQGRSENGNVVLSVSDNGLGIPEDQIEQIGERFFRASNSTGIVGTGVGLNMARVILKAHGGELEVQSVLKQGSTFKINLPKKPEMQESQRQSLSEVTQELLSTKQRVQRIVYKSTATEAFDEDMISKLTQKSAKRNSDCGITGALCYANNQFAQVLEGSESEVQKLVKRIEMDPRHSDLTVLFSERISRRAYDGWRMQRVHMRPDKDPVEALLMDIELRAD